MINDNDNDNDQKSETRSCCNHICYDSDISISITMTIGMKHRYLFLVDKFVFVQGFKQKSSIKLLG